MTQLQTEDGTWHTLQRAVPQIVYNNERDIYLERNEGDDDFLLLGDNGVVPKFLSFRMTKVFGTRQIYEDYLSYLVMLCDNVVAVSFGTGRNFEVNFGFFTQQEMTNQLHIRFTIHLATDTEGIGEVLWGSESVLLGATYVYLSGTVIE